MRATPTLLAIGLTAALALAAGCRTPPPPRIQIPLESRGNPYTTYEHDPVKPMPPHATQPAEGAPPQSSTGPQPPAQPPAVSQAYLESYDRVGRPRLVVLVERTSPPPRSIVPGYYETLERVVREALAAEGQVAIVPPAAARQLKDDQLKNIHAGEAKAIADAGDLLHADVVVQVRVSAAGSAAAERDDTQITATARNARDARQIATAAASIPPPPQRRQIDFAGRLLAERLVDELAAAWDDLSRIPPATGDATTQPAPAPATQPDRTGLTR